MADPTSLTQWLLLRVPTTVPGGGHIPCPQPSGCDNPARAMVTRLRTARDTPLQSQARMSVGRIKISLNKTFESFKISF